MDRYAPGESVIVGGEDCEVVTGLGGGSYKLRARGTGRVFTTEGRNLTRSGRPSREALKEQAEPGSAADAPPVDPDKEAEREGARVSNETHRFPVGTKLTHGAEVASHSDDGTYVVRDAKGNLHEHIDQGHVEAGLAEPPPDDKPEPPTDEGDLPPGWATGAEADDNGGAGADRPDDEQPLERCEIRVSDQGIATAVYRYEGNSVDGVTTHDENVGDWSDNDIVGCFADLLGLHNEDVEKVTVVRD